ncbi:MAG: hypothetical protein JXB32_04305 [Deltaproteobacteria bacterium]|nr:hypothetical protein [Deltaproteobacteria bacterium]
MPKRCVWGIVGSLVLGGCSLLYPFELPEADGGDVPDAEDVVEVPDGPDGDDSGAVCGNGVVEPGEQCDTDESLGPCTTSCGSAGTGRCVGCREVCEAPVDEECNGLDDDCDGLTDEDFACAAGSTVACTTPCGLEGTGACTATCEPPGRTACAAAVDVCNGCDDDRDGTTDEGCVCATEWAVEHPVASGADIQFVVSFAPDDTGFAVGMNGTIVRFVDSGWVRVRSPVTYNLRGLHVLSASFAVAVGTNGAVLWWRGGDWSYDDTTGTSQSLYGVWAAAEDDVWVAGANGTMLHWNGLGWAAVPSGTTSHLWRIWGRANDDIMAVGRLGAAVHYDGSAWTQVAPASIDWEISSTWSPGGGVWYIGGHEGRLVRWDVGAGTWTPVATGTTGSIEALWGTGPDDIWAVGGWVEPIVLHYDGTAWAPDDSVPRIDPMGYYSIASRASGDLVIAARSGGMLQRSGGVWRPMEGAATYTLRSLWGNSPQEVYALGTAVDGTGAPSTAVLQYDGTAWRLPHWRARVGARDGWSDAGDLVLVNGDDSLHRFDGTAWEAWNVMFLDATLLALWGTSVDDLWAVGGPLGSGQPGVFHRSGGSWTPWTVEPPVTGVELLDVTGLGADLVLAVGTGGTVLRRNAAGTALEALASGTTETLRSVWALSATEAFAVGDGGTILRWDGTAWTTMSSPADPWAGRRLDGVWAGSPTSAFAVGEGGLLLRYDGSGWTEQPFASMSNLAAVWGSSANNVFVASAELEGVVLHRCGPAW